MIGDDVRDQAVVQIQHARLEQETFAKIPCADAHRIEGLHGFQDILHHFDGDAALLAQLLDGQLQVSVPVQVADDQAAHLFFNVGGREH